MIRIGGALAAFLLLCSCSLTNPYVRSDLLKCDGVTTPDGNCNLSSSDYAGGAAAAIKAANDQRNLYISEMGNQYSFNAAMGLGVIGLSADAIYKGITSKTSLPNKSLAAVGTGAAGLYGLDSWLHSKATESAYIIGFQGITCTLLRTRAILLPTDRFAAFETDLASLQEKIAEVDQTLSKLQVEWDFGEEIGKTLEKGEKQNLERELSNIYKTLATARKLLLTARAFEGEINSSGQTIRNQVDLIVASVSSQLAQSEPNVSALKGLIGSYSDPSKGISGLQGIALTQSTSSVTTPFYVASTTPQGGLKSGKPGVGAEADKEDPAAEKEANPVHPNEYNVRKNLRETVWLQVSELYAQSRKINAVLDTSQHFYASTRRISACELGGGPPPLEITPASVDDPVTAGKTLKFSISGGIGIPEVSLTGSTGASAADSKTQDLVLGVNGNALTATVTILPTASGTLTLLAADKSQPPQQVKVTMDVEKGASTAKPSFKAIPGDKTITLHFAPPLATGGTLIGYAVSLSTTNAAENLTLKFPSPKSGTKATGSGSISGVVSADAGGNTTIALGALTNGESYTIGLTADFNGASDVEFTSVTGVKPDAPAPTVPKPSAPTIKETSSKAGILNVTVDPPANGSTLITGYVATAKNVEKAKAKDKLTGKSKGTQTSIDIAKCTPGDDYVVTVVATSKLGSGASSRPSSPVKCNSAG
jgi:hypothetical protein